MKCVVRFVLAGLLPAVAFASACGDDDGAADVPGETLEIQETGGELGDAPADLAPDAAPDVEPDAAPDVALDVEPDAAPDVALEGSGDGPEETHEGEGGHEGDSETHEGEGGRDGRDGHDGTTEVATDAASFCETQPRLCGTSADCVAYSDYTDPDCCTCDPYNAACAPVEPATCDCFVDPCVGHTAECVGGECVIR